MNKPTNYIDFPNVTGGYHLVVREIAPEHQRDVFLRVDGHTYDREQIEQLHHALEVWLKTGELPK